MTLPPYHFAVHAVILLIAMNVPAAEKTVFDFRTATNTTGWQVVNDDSWGTSAGCCGGNYPP
jgi:hypothetical protein